MFLESCFGLQNHEKTRVTSDLHNRECYFRFHILFISVWLFTIFIFSLLCFHLEFKNVTLFSLSFLFSLCWFQFHHFLHKNLKTRNKYKQCDIFFYITSREVWIETVNENRNQTIQYICFMKMFYVFIFNFHW